MENLELFYKKVNYIDNDGKEKSANNFYLKIGNALIPIEIKYFKNKETGVDSQYQGRKTVLLTFAKELKD